MIAFHCCLFATNIAPGQVQHLLGLCADHLDKGDSYQAPAVIGIALVAMAEELGLEMAIRSLEHLLQYGEQNIRRAVPLALGILSIANPKVCSCFMLEGCERLLECVHVVVVIDFGCPNCA